MVAQCQVPTLLHDIVARQCLVLHRDRFCSGDFHQLPPVAKGREAAAARKFAFEAASWRQCIHHCAQLTKVFRQVYPTLITTASAYVVYGYTIYYVMKHDLHGRHT